VNRVVVNIPSIRARSDEHSAVAGQTVVLTLVQVGIIVRGLFIHNGGTSSSPCGLQLPLQEILMNSAKIL
jgi:hypothetical protein